MRQMWPLTLMLCADRVPNKNAHFRRSALTQAGSPDPRNDRICITSSCPRQLVLPIYLLACLMPPATVSALCISRPDHDGPGHPRNLVGERHGRHLGWPTFHQSCEPRPPLGSVLARVADDGHCADDKQPPQISIALLGDAAEPVFAAGGVLLRHQPDPDRKTAPRREAIPVADLGNQCGGADRADAWDLRQPPARLTGAVGA